MTAEKPFAATRMTWLVCVVVLTIAVGLIVAARSAPVSTPAPMPDWSTSGARQVQGAMPVGTTRYVAPARAVYADCARGTPTGTGTATRPYASAQAAIDRASSGSTIVLRAGTYHESLTVPAGKRLTIQSFPGEAVWLDGSQVMQRWTKSGTVWYASGWNDDFDSSPTFTRGAPDGAADGWRWIDPAKPLAAHPEQVWIDGAPLQQVASLEAVGEGTFFADVSAKRLYIGTDPAGQEVRAAILTKAMTVRGAGATVRGIGIRRYATSVWMMGAVTIEAPQATFENVAIYDSASTGVFVGSADATLTRMTVARNGLLGVGANNADNLRLRGLLVLQNNSEGFNSAPVSGGAKVAKTRGLEVTDSAFLRNSGPGLWVDESVYDVGILRNDFVGNTGTGVVLELSQRVDVIDNLILDNKGNGVKINNTGDVQLWNNTIVGADRPLNIVQDARRADDPLVPGHDRRQPFPDPTMPWLTKDITVSNNVIADSSGNCTFCVEDYSSRYTAEQMRVSSDGNLFHRVHAGTPAWLVVWSRGSVNENPAVFENFDDYVASTGQDTSSVSIDARAAIEPTGRLKAGLVLRPVAPPASAAAWGAKPRVGASFT